MCVSLLERHHTHTSVELLNAKNKEFLYILYRCAQNPRGQFRSGKRGLGVIVHRRALRPIYARVARMQNRHRRRDPASHHHPGGPGAVRRPHAYACPCCPRPPARRGSCPSQKKRKLAPSWRRQLAFTFDDLNMRHIHMDFVETLAARRARSPITERP